MSRHLTRFGEVLPTEEGLWAIEPSFKQPTDEEYYQAYKSLEKHLSSFFPSRSQYYEKCYVRGDNCGDYTQFLEILDPLVFSIDLILNSQKWVKANPFWRIACPCHLGPSFVFAVYARTIRYANDSALSLRDAVFDTKSALESFEGSGK